MTTRKRGVLTFAYGSTYQRMAYAQALTLGVQGIPLTVVVPCLEFPALDNVANVVVVKKPFSKFEWEALAYSLSPYDTTIKTDADVIFPAHLSLDPYFEVVERFELVSGFACNLQGVRSNCDWYRKTETYLDWPPFYSALCGFTKTKTAQQFFDKCAFLFQNWWKLSDIVGCLPATTDSVFSLAYRDLVLANRVLVGLKFIHAKQGICGQSFHDKWCQDVAVCLDDEANLFIGGQRLEVPFHYFDKDFLSPLFLAKLENVLLHRI